MDSGAPEPRGVYLVGLVIVLGVELENFGLLGIDKILNNIIHLKILPPGLAFGVHLLGQGDVEFPGSEKSELNRSLLAVVDVEGGHAKRRRTKLMVSNLSVCPSFSSSSLILETKAFCSGVVWPG